MNTSPAPTSPLVPTGLADRPNPVSTAGFRSPTEIAAGKSAATAAANQAPVAEASSTQPAAPATTNAKAKPTRKTAAKPAKPRSAAERKQRIPPLTRLERFNVDNLIVAAPVSETDASLSDRASALCTRAVSVQYIKDARIALGLKSVAEPTKAEMRVMLAEAQRKLAEMQNPPLPGFAIGGAEQRQRPDLVVRGIPTGDRALGKLIVGAINTAAGDAGIDPVDLAEANEQARQGAIGNIGREGDGDHAFERVDTVMGHTTAGTFIDDGAPV